MRVIEIDSSGGFPSLVLEAKKAFASTYGLKAEYWQHFEPDSRPDVLSYLKTNLTDLANYYHACYRDPGKAKDKTTNLKEALHWYREFLISFPRDAESPAINYRLADLLLENGSFGEAAVEYEKTAYDYPPHENSAKAGYAAVYAYRKHLAAVGPEEKDLVKQEVVRSSLRFADAFPTHEKAAVVLGAAADDLYDMKEYQRAHDAASKLLEKFPETDAEIVRRAWLVVGHSSYELQCYSEAETAYSKVLSLLPKDDKTRDELMDNLAASIYKQGEQANAAKDYRAAADHFLRVGRVAPNSKIRPNAEYDAAAALIRLKDWDKAASVLVGFRKAFPGHKLQLEVTKKLAYVYKENYQLSMAASEYERIERESNDDEIRRDALQEAAELYDKNEDSVSALKVYRRYVDYFPQPVELNLETRNKIAKILKAQNDRESYLKELEQIVEIDASAGSARTSRTRYLAAKAALVLAQSTYDKFVAVKLVKPLKVNLHKKRDLMERAIQEFNRLVDYEFGDVTAAATFYLAEIYADFSKDLTTSERPDGLNPQEKEDYELAIENQAYPFEEKAIAIHESNLKLISRGVYNEWIDKSLQRLAKFVPARFDKPEEHIGIISSLGTYVFEIERPTPSTPPTAEAKTPIGGAEQTDLKPAEPNRPEESVSLPTVKPPKKSESEAPGPSSKGESTAAKPAEGSVSDPVAEPGSIQETQPAEAKPDQEAGSVPTVEPPKQGQIERPSPSSKGESTAAKPAEGSVSAPATEHLKSGQVEAPDSVEEVDHKESNPDLQPGSTGEVEPAGPNRSEESVSLPTVEPPKESENEAPGPSSKGESTAAKPAEGSVSAP
ncbi:MAG: tetratricopeptide repeat protein, partial [Acidobacteriota bacterium]